MIHELRFERVKRWGMDGLEPSGTAERGLGRVHTNQKERERESGFLILIIPFFLLARPLIEPTIGFATAYDHAAGSRQRFLNRAISLP